MSKDQSEDQLLRPTVKDKTKMAPSQQNLEAGFHRVR